VAFDYLGVAEQEDVLSGLKKGVEEGHVLLGDHHTAFAASAGKGENGLLGHRLVAVEHDIALAVIVVGGIEAVEAVTDAILSLIPFGNAAMAEGAEPRFFLVAETGGVFAAALWGEATALAVSHGALEKFVLFGKVPHPQTVAPRGKGIVYQKADFSIHVVLDNIVPGGVYLCLAGVGGFLAT
jgi:hypothetical protein